MKGTILITRCEFQKVVGEEEYCHYILCLHKYKALTTFYLQENTYAEINNFARDYKETAQPLSCPQHFSGNGLGKKLLSYYSVPFLLFLIQR